MEIERNRFDCQLMGTNLCDFIGCDGCDNCIFARGIDKHTDVETMINNWDVTLSYIPENIDELHESETCVFCGKNHAEEFAELSLAHPEPENKRGMFFGFGRKVRMPIGSLIDVPIAVCKDCKRRIRMKDHIQIFGSLAIAAIAIIAVIIPGVETALTRIHWSLPILLFVAILGLGWLLVNYLANLQQKKLAEKIFADPLKIPQIADAINRGWFPMPEPKKGFARLAFAKKKKRVNFRFHSK